VNVAVEAPAGTVTEAGTVAADVMLDESPTTTPAPPTAAWPVRVTVPVEETPPATDVGATDTADRTAGVTVIDFVTVPLSRESVAVMFTEVLAATPVVVIVNVVFDAPAGTVMVAGTEATAALFELSEIT